MKPLQEVKLTEKHPLYEYFIDRIWTIDDVLDGGICMILYRVNEQSGKTEWLYAEEDWVKVIPRKENK